MIDRLLHWPLLAGLCLLPALTPAQDLPGQASNVLRAQPQAVATAGRPAAGTSFVMTAFPATSQSLLSVLTSKDGVTYTSLASETYAPPQGLLRDPSITRLPDGSYLVAYTTGWSGQTLGLARSTDLRRWAHVADVKVELAGVTNVWAPEWFRDADGSLSLIVSLSTSGTQGPFSAYRLAALNPEATRFAAPVQLQGLDRNPIDTFVVRQGGRYVAITKNETTKQLERAWADQLNGPWTYDRTGDWAGLGSWIEGPALAPIVDAQGRAGWRLYFDDYIHKTVRFADSFDGLDTWTSPREVIGASGSVRHFTVLPESREQLARVTASKGKPQAITWDRHSLMFDGRRQMIWAAEFHPFRLPSPSLWRDILQKLKASGFNAVSIYFAWGFHSAAPGHYDFSGIRNVERVLEMAREEGLYVIARPGPYVNGEITAGGFPAWLARQRAEARTDAPEYQAAAGEWLTQINALIARHQLSTGGGTVIAYQLENEQFEVEPKNARHMQFLADKARADGITVPLFHNAASRLPDWTPKNSTAPFANPGPTDLYAFDGYPGGVCNVAGEPGSPNSAPDWGAYGQNFPRVGSKASPHTPGFAAEIGAGWFDYWGSNGTYPCIAERLGIGYQRLFYGTNLINKIAIHSIYMGFGGTSWGWMPAPVVFTSYDYGAPIDEARRLRPKALTGKAMGHFIQAANPVLAQMDLAEPIKTDNPGVKLHHNVDAASGTHVLLASQQPSSNTGTQAFSFEIDIAGQRYRVPSHGSMRLAGQDAKLLLANYRAERQQLVVSTSELFTHAAQGERDLVVLHGRTSETGETVLRYARQPRVKVLAGQAQSHWDAARGDLRLTYTHQGLIELQIEGADRAPLRLLIADEAVAMQLWPVKAGAAMALVQSPALVRGGTFAGRQLQLQGDTLAASALRVWSVGVDQVQWNGLPVAMSRDLQSREPLAGPAPFQLPDLMAQPWQRRQDSPEAQPGFDDRAWRVADATSTAANVYTASEKGQPVLAMSDYGFHRGDVWYRGRFTTGAGTPAGTGPLRLELFVGTGGAGLVQVWLDGRFLGQHEIDGGRPFPETTDTFKLDLKDLAAGEHVLAVMVRNMAHNWDLFADDQHKEARGLITASLAPKPGRRNSVPIAWKLQGQPELIADLTRGPYNSGGLFGERRGWHLPVDPKNAKADEGWTAARVQDAPQQPGTYWLRTRFSLDLPKAHDVQLGLAFGDTTQPRSNSEHRALIFVNGWNLGQFIAHIGPQRVFVLPPGILNPNGENTLTLAITSDGQAANAPEPVRLVLLQAARGGVPLEAVAQPHTLQR